jgi:hypothetical protein
MTRWGYIAFALVVVMVTSSINWDDARGSGGRGWGGSSSSRGWSSGGGGHK